MQKAISRINTIESVENVNTINTINTLAEMYDTHRWILGVGDCIRW